MVSGLRRTVGWATLVAAVCSALWMFVGPPHDWEGGMEWLRRGLMVVAVASIHLGVKLIFPEARGDASETVRG